ncbi:MAG: hypothetical protein PHR82_09545 [Endomicrobiaceae bacterium]|nr:hypothetical protein [Endomicrobiaceae bacterium]
MHKHSIFEYKSIEKFESQSYFNGFDRFLRKNKIEHILQITHKNIKVSHYVGVIKYKNHQFEILPKLASDEKQVSIILKNLFFMLSYTKNLDIKNLDYAKLAQNKNPFLEALISLYATTLSQALKRLTPKQYEYCENNLSHIKGKLNFTKNIKNNLINKAKFYCEYNEFAENNILNWIFNYVSTLLLKITENKSNKKNLLFIKQYYFDVDLKKIDISELKKIKLTQAQKLFEKPFKLARIFLENTSVDMSNNKVNTIALFWDMNKLFEEFIYCVINKNKTLLNLEYVEYQKGKRLLRNENGSLYGNTYADIFIQPKNQSGFVLDVKYKLHDGNLNSFINADVFQMLAYETLHHVNNGVLLHPSRDDKSCHHYQYNIDSETVIGKHMLKIASINLKIDSLEENISSIIEHLFVDLKLTN